MYGVGGSLEENSPVAQWLRTLDRVNLDEFYQNEEEVPNEKVREYGQIYAKYFSDMVTGDDVVAPDAFPFDITANGLPNLWASAGWVPMYAWDSERNKKNFIKTRGMYAYAEGNLSDLMHPPWRLGMIPKESLDHILSSWPLGSHSRR